MIRDGRPNGPVERIAAVIFDTDGVVTRTATVHAAAWKRMFDEYLRHRSETTGEPFTPFSDEDYVQYVDGRARDDGIATFLESRGIVLPVGDAADPPDRETVRGLGNRKNQYFLAQLRARGVEAFDGTIDLVRRLRHHGFGVGVVSASENCAEVLGAAGVASLFDVRVDGRDAATLRLMSKPDPALYFEAARRLGTVPGHTAVVEDALAGVEAGQRGRFGLVVGVDRTGRAALLIDHGADIVVHDLASLDIDEEGRWAVVPERSQHG